MDGLDLGALIGIGALLALVILIMPFAARHDRRMARRRCADGDTAIVASSAAVFGGDGSCSDGGGSC